MNINFEYQCTEGDAGAMGVEVDVTANFEGRYIPARMYPIDHAHPAEYPSMALTILLDGMDVRVGRNDYLKITDSAWELWNEEYEI